MLNQVRIHKWGALFAAVLMAVVTASPLFAAKQVNWEKSVKEGMEKAKETGKPMMMDFFTEW